MDVNSKILNKFDWIENLMKQLLEVATSGKSFTERVDINVRDIKRSNFCIEFHHLVQFLAPEILPETVLQKAQSFARRDPTMSLASHQIIKTDRILRTWALADRSSLLVVRMGPRAQKQARELAADAISVLTKNGQRVLWNISLPRSSERNWTMGDVFKSLLHQVLRDSAALFTQFTEQLNLEKIQAAHTDSEWADLICLLFAKVSDTFIVIETQDLRQVPQHDPESAKRLLQLLQRVANRAAAAGNPLKILLVVYGNVLQALTAASKDIDLVITSILPPPPVPPRLRHIARRAGLNMRGWKLQTPKV